MTSLSLPAVQTDMATRFHSGSGQSSRGRGWQGETLPLLGPQLPQPSRRGRRDRGSEHTYGGNCFMGRGRVGATQKAGGSPCLGDREMQGSGLRGAGFWAHVPGLPFCFAPHSLVSLGWAGWWESRTREARFPHHLSVQVWTGWPVLLMSSLDFSVHFLCRFNFLFSFYCM